MRELRRTVLSQLLFVMIWHGMEWLLLMVFTFLIAKHSFNWGYGGGLNKAIIRVAQLLLLQCSKSS